jgi:hypothetical protein
MLTEPQDLREDVDELVERLARIDGHRVVLRGVADSLDGSHTLASVLDQLERDLTLTARQTDRLRARAVSGRAR